MLNKISSTMIKSMLAIALAIPLFTTVNVSNAEAGHKHRRTAIIAGAIIGGAIAYHHYRKRKHRSHRSYHSGPRYKVRRHHRGYRHRGHRRGGFYRGHRRHHSYGRFHRGPGETR